jgi:hypothetical protein
LSSTNIFKNEFDSRKEVHDIEGIPTDAVMLVGFNPDTLEKTKVAVNDNGQVSLGGNLVNEAYDSIYATYPDTETEMYTYKLDGATVAVVTVVYSDSTKVQLTSVVKS